MSDDLNRLADRAGVERTYLSLMGPTVTAAEAPLRATLKALGVPADDDRAVVDSLANVPPRDPGPMQAPEGVACYVPDWLRDSRCWGVACQIYSLRSRRNWGMGDFEDLARFAEIVAAAGGDFIGVNPLHALFMADARKFSPFSPSSRHFLNPLYIALDKVPGADTVLAEMKVPADVHGATFVDYARVGPFKRRALTFLFRAFRESGDAAAAQEFADYVAAGGRPLYLHALFEAVSQAMVEEGHSASWHGWPEEYRHPANKAVTAFAAAHGEDIAFHCWLQWTAERQLADAQARAKAAGMRIGLYLDMAVGVAPDGSATWSDRELTVPSVRIGAPPDYYNADGQDWGVAPLSPAVLQARDYEPYREVIDTVLRHAGALRIDHAMSLYRLFWISEGFTAADGVYVRYPLAAMLRTLAEVSQQNQAIVIGEALGVVPPGFPEVLSATEIQAYVVYFFEKRGEQFIPVAEYPREALACITTHDLHTLAGWWSAHDLKVRVGINYLPADQFEQALVERASERHHLLVTLNDHRLLPDDMRAVFEGRVPPPETLPGSVATALHRLVARSPSRLFVLAVEDLTADQEQVNIPGTVDEHPNWRRKIACDIEELAQQPFFRAITAALREERPR
jgi:4-alpha-glucanotransferase